MAEEEQNQTPALLKRLHGELMSRVEYFKGLLPDSISPKRFALIAYSHVRKNKDLMKCEPMNVIAEVSKAAELGLDFSIPNEVSLVPFNDYKSRTTRCIAIPGYKGYAKLALFSPHVKSLSYNVVHEGDVFEVELGSDPKVIHKPKFPASGAVVSFYALGVSKTGGMFGPVVMSVEEIENHAKRYIKAGFGPFGTVKTEGRGAEHFKPYGLKTVLLQLCKRHLPLSAKGMQILENDLSVMEAEKARHDTEKGPDINAALGIGSDVDQAVVDAEWSMTDEPRPDVKASGLQKS